MISDMEGKITERLGDYIFGAEDDTLPGEINKLLRSQGKTIAVAENFTGGWLSYALSSAGGAEHTFIAGLVVRDYRQLQESAFVQLGEVPPSAQEQAGYMASLVRKQCGSDIGLAVAVESGESARFNIAEYNFYIAGNCHGQLMLKNVIWNGEREAMTRFAATMVMVLLWRYLKLGIPFEQSLPWESWLNDGESIAQ
jgi:nicotinamide-nucleotide amidase